MGNITLLLGGAKSGKSSYALQEAGMLEGRKAFVATAEPLDEEMAERIARHKKDRQGVWDTYEESLKIEELLIQISERYDVIIIDCMTLWVSNLLHSADDVDKRFESLISALLSIKKKHIFIVSNETGMGIVPEYPLGRIYRDYLGTLNKRIADIADTVILMVAGIPLKIK